MKTRILALLFSALPIAAYAQDSKSFIEIDADFPGGNIIVDEESTAGPSKSSLYYTIPGEQEIIKLRPDFRDTQGHWFYWYFRVSGAEGKTLTFQFDGPRLGAFGPAYSVDGGATWRWLSESPSRESAFTYTFAPNQSEVFFSVGIPYLEADFNRFIAAHKKHPHLSVSSLTTSSKGRNIEKLTIHNRARRAEHKVLITARHHACEMMASFVLEGIIDALLSEDEPMNWLRENVEFVIVPFMDKDGVQDGDQGKNRRPWDHNRDYAGESIYASTAALRDFASSWSEGRLRIGLDLHCPYLLGNKHEFIHLVGSSDPQIERQQLRFSSILEQHQKGQLVFRADSFLSFGTDWNVGTTTGQMNFASFIASFESTALATTLEFPYAISDDQQVTPDNARSFGRDLAAALAIYLQDLEK